jgi:hypothetical protein
VKKTRGSGQPGMVRQAPGLSCFRVPSGPGSVALDWRTCEAKLNAVPQFIAEIDGLDIEFISRSRGSVIEQLKIVDPLTNPTAHGASASDAFHLVIPSMPDYGLSGKPTSTGWDPTASHGPG